MGAAASVAALRLFLSIKFLFPRCSLIYLNRVKHKTKTNSFLFLLQEVRPLIYPKMCGSGVVGGAKGVGAQRYK